MGEREGKRKIIQRGIVKRKRITFDRFIGVFFIGTS